MIGTESRRNKGEGSLYYNEEKSVYISQNYLELPDGTKKRVSGSSKKSKSAAIRKRKENEKKALRKHKLEQNKIKVKQKEEKKDQIGTLNFNVERYIKSKSNLHQSSDVYYKSYYEGYIKDSELGNMKVNEITEDMLLDYYTFLSKHGNKRSKGKEGLAISTINHVRQIISSTFKRIYEEGIIESNPHKNIKKFKKGSKMDKDTNKSVFNIKKHILEDDEVKGLIEHGHGNRFYYMFLLTLLWGTRRGEMLALKWSAINIEKRTVHICETLAKVEDKTGITENKYMFIAKEPKSKKSNRILPLSDEALKFLDLQRQKNELDKMVAGEKYIDNDLVFPHELGGYLSGDRVHNNFKIVMKKAGIKGHTFHDLRHTFASKLIDNGESIKLVSELLGHSSTGITLDTYADLFKEADTKAMRKLSLNLLNLS